MSRSHQLFTLNPLTRTFTMFQTVFFTCLVHTAFSIIVTDPPPTSTEYNYFYDIVDPSTGDTKSLHEVRQGDVVKGSYSVVDPDGTKRIVDYTADSRNGFKAIVRNEPIRNQSPIKYYYNPSTNFDTSYIRRPQHGYLVPDISPVPYLKKLNVMKFSVDNFIQNNQVMYFTPGNDTSSESLTFGRGQYFIPNYMHN